jgi:hypothetical protein
MWGEGVRPGWGCDCAADARPWRQAPTVSSLTSDLERRGTLNAAAMAPAGAHVGDAGLLRPLVSSRTAGPPCSNVCAFHVDALPGASFCAFALPDGTIVVQKV